MITNANAFENSWILFMSRHGRITLELSGAARLLRSVQAALFAGELE